MTVSAPAWLSPTLDGVRRSADGAVEAFVPRWRALRSEFREALARQDGAAMVEVLRRMEAALLAQAQEQVDALRAAVAASGIGRKVRRRMRPEIDRKCAAIMAAALDSMEGIRPHEVEARLAAAKADDAAVDDDWAGMLADAFKED